ncbi:MAG: S1 RNA-binding domain-containing protein [Butyricicoccus sp.]
MKEKYMPEGVRLEDRQNKELTRSPAGLRTARDTGTIVESIAVSCDPGHNLIVRLGETYGIIPRNECALGIESGETREIAILSRVGKPVCFVVTEVEEGRVLLSRRLAQERALAWLLANLRPGDVIPACVTHLEPFGAFVDVGCGVVSFIGIENISVSRIFHPRERFSCGQMIHAAVLGTDPAARRIHLTHRELLGTWAQNAALFHAGETVQGIVRSMEPYGIFIELAPNLSGLAERRTGLREGDRVSVYIKSILPERMKIKLNVIDVLRRPVGPPPTLRYFIEDGHIDQWVFTPPCCKTKYIATDFVTPP